MASLLRNVLCFWIQFVALVESINTPQEWNDTERAVRAVPSKNMVLVQASPSTVYPALTKDVSVNCSFTKQPGSKIQGIVSISISKSEEKTEYTYYRELASVTSVSPDHVTIRDDLGGHVSGHLVPDGQSYINYQWDLPSDAVPGRYKCEVSGINEFGHPVAIIGTADVITKPVDQDVILTRLRELDSCCNNKTKQLQTIFETKFQNQQRFLDTLWSQVEKTFENDENVTNQVEKKLDEQKLMFESMLQQQQTLIQTLESRLEAKINDHQILINIEMSQLFNETREIKNIMRRLNDTRDAVMEFSANHSGHHYFLSRPIWREVTVMDHFCRLWGGYLAEINDSVEFTFVRKFLESSLANEDKELGQRSWVFIGGSDYGHHGNWTYQRTGESVDNIFWGPGQPDGRNHCLMMSHKQSWAMSDDKCNNADWQRFLCEIP